jgi:hypothetical protein
LENDVSARLIRQRRLRDDQSPLKLAAIIDEAALHRCIGGPEVMGAQLRHLAEAADLDTVTVQVIPNKVGAHEGMDGAFTLLEFQEVDDPNLLYAEYLTGAVHVEKKDETGEAKLVFDRLRSVALPPDDSVAFIQRVADECYSL